MFTHKRAVGGLQSQPFLRRCGRCYKFCPEALSQIPQQFLRLTTIEYVQQSLRIGTNNTRCTEVLWVLYKLVTPVNVCVRRIGNVEPRQFSVTEFARQ